MSKFIIAMTLTLFLAAGNSAFAKPGGGSPSGHSEDHMSTEGTANTNGPDAADRDKGKERAEDRHEMHTEGHADKHHGKHHGKGHGHDGDEHKDTH
jgi:hypothetical protein